MAFDTTDTAGSLPAWKWTGAQTLDFVYALNERCLQVLGRQVTQDGRIFSASLTPEKTKARQRVWSELDDAAWTRAAKCPFLLIDIRFHDETWWHEVKEGAPAADGESPELNIFPAEAARELSAETLTLAWHSARSDPRIASQVLGIAPGVVGVIASLGPREVQRVAARHSHQLRPRWEGNAAFWEELLRTALSVDAAALSDFHLHALQLLGGDLLNPL